MNSHDRPELATTNLFEEAFEQFSETALFQRLKDKFKPKPYYLKFKPLRYIALAASYLFNVFSGFTASVLVFFFADGLTGSPVAAVLITVAFIALIEITKRKTNSVLFRDVLQFKRASFAVVALASFALLISGLSITSSYYGADRTVKEFTPPPPPVNTDTITAPIRAQLAEIDQQIKEAQNTKWMGTTTRTSQQAIKHLSEQKTLLTSRLIAVENRTDESNVILMGKHEQETTITARRFALATLVSELLFILCAFYLEFYDYRSLAEFATPTSKKGPQDTPTAPAPPKQEKPEADPRTEPTPEGIKYTNPTPMPFKLSKAAEPGLNGHEPEAFTGRRMMGFFPDREPGTILAATIPKKAADDTHTKIVCDEMTIPDDTKRSDPEDRRRTCQNCGERYTYNHKKQKYCSPSCRKEYWTKQNGRKPYMKRKK
jgi:hypothetical protein